MPAVNRRSRVSPAKPQAVQHCASLLSCSDNKLVKVRSIGCATPAGGSEVQVALPSGDSLQCVLSPELQGQLLFRGSGFFIVAPPAPVQSKHNSQVLASSSSKEEEQSQQQQQQSVLDSWTHLALQHRDEQSIAAADGKAGCWRVIHVLADEDPPELARQGLWPPQFEAEGIDGISNGQIVDLRTVPRVEPPSQPEKPVVQKSAVLNRTFYDSEEDEEDEEHELGCACCPGGRNVVFRVY
ncbi:TPA: hypothetical protein ACH3X2_007665 [Trebouxia sp. C0005]